MSACLCYLCVVVPTCLEVYTMPVYLCVCFVGVGRQRANQSAVQELTGCKLIGSHFCIRMNCTSIVGHRMALLFVLLVWLQCQTTLPLTPALFHHHHLVVKKAATQPWCTFQLASCNMGVVSKVPLFRYEGEGLFVLVLPSAKASRRRSRQWMFFWRECCIRVVC